MFRRLFSLVSNLSSGSVRISLELARERPVLLSKLPPEKLGIVKRDLGGFFYKALKLDTIVYYA